MRAGALLTCLLLLAPPAPATAPAAPLATPLPTLLPTPLPSPLQRAVEAARSEGTMGEALGRFYAARALTPAWFLPGGVPRPEVQRYLAALCEAPGEGLEPEHYGAQRLAAAVARVEAGEGDWVEVELALTRSFLRYASDLARGQLAPKRFGWPTRPREVDVAHVLSDALLGGDVEGALEALEPPHPGYRRLRAALVRYEALAEAGGWPLVPEGPTLSRGAHGERVRLLRERLAATGDLAAAGDGAADGFDEAVEVAVRRFQRRHGLVEDGTVGGRTLRALRVPAQVRVEQLRANLERWRWLPADLGERYVLVNLATFELTTVEDGQARHRMRVITGEPDWRTPLLKDRITHLIVNPRWAVPERIAKEEVLPHLQEDPGWAAQVGLQVYDAKGEEVDPAQVDWSAVDPEAIPFLFRQGAGPDNPLGNLKFMTTNRYQVILHDTPNTRLFQAPRRTFSHGCVRVADPQALASFLLQSEDGRRPEALSEALASEDTERVPLPAPVPVYLLYWTADVAPDGTVRFAPDVYGEDARLMRALPRPRAPAPPAACAGPPAGVGGAGSGR